MKEIEIKQINYGVGFSKPTTTILPGAIFDDGQIAYLKDDTICTAYDEKTLVKSLKQGNTQIEIIHKENKE